MMQLTLNHVGKRYGEKQALNDVSLSLTEGIYGLLGPNGAGKSTMMNLITGNLKPSSGELLWNGREISALGAEYRGILGYAPQQQGLYDTFTGRRFLAYLAALKNIRKPDIAPETERVLSYVNLTEAADRPIGTYSGGMKQRILIAQAILGDPRLVVLDEPTAGLDPKERVRIREKIRELSGNRIILVSTHVVSDIQSIAKEVILLKDGRIADQDTVIALCQKYGDSDDLEQVYMHVFGEEEADEDGKTPPV
jgi:ABC-2 type transport system ATP-binding protein